MPVLTTADLTQPHPSQTKRERAGALTDQYALACVTYQLLTGTLPFERDQGMAVLLAHLSAPPPSLGSRRPGLPPAADEVLARALAKAPEHRYGSCLEFADALREALGMAPYDPRGPVCAADHPQTQIVSPPPRSPGPASPASDAVPTVTKAAPSPANSAAGHTDAGSDMGPTAPRNHGERRATPAPCEDRPRVTAEVGKRFLGVVETIDGDEVWMRLLPGEEVGLLPSSQLGRPRSSKRRKNIGRLFPGAMIQVEVRGVDVHGNVTLALVD